MPEELLTEVHNTIQEAVIPSPRKRNEKKQNGCLRRPYKSEFGHLNAKVQRITRRDKKTFLSEQCKEIEENNRMGKTRDLFKKIRDTKGTFHAKMAQ